MTRKQNQFLEQYLASRFADILFESYQRTGQPWVAHALHIKLKACFKRLGYDYSLVVLSLQCLSSSSCQDEDFNALLSNIS